MAGKTSPRKLIFFIILTLFLIAGFSVSTYYYIMGRYTDQVVGMVESVMQDFTSEELESFINDEELLLALNEWKESKNELDGLLDDLDGLNVQGTGNENTGDESDSADNSNSDSGGSEINIQDEGNNSDSESDSESSNNDSNNSNSSSNDGVSENGDGDPSESNNDNQDDSTKPAEDDKNNSGTPDIPQEVDQSLANKLTAQDTVFILQVYRKFSAGERDELKSLYAEGGNNDLIKEKVQARLTPEEIEKSLDIALRILN